MIKCMVIRTDEHGNAFLISENLTEAQADALLAKFHGHKQYYTKIFYTSLTRAQIVAQHGITV